MESTPYSVLVIDADVSSRNYLAAMLGKSGYTVLLSSMGREGLISAWKDKPDLIILDPVMPDLSGLELITRLRQDRRTANVPCVVLSSREDAQDMAALLAAGCGEYMLKSSQALPKLLEIVQRLLDPARIVNKKDGKLVTFLSAKGGTGVSSLCANFAMCLGSRSPDIHVAVMDMVLPIGSIANIVGYDGQLNLVTAAMQSAEQLTPAYFKDNLPRIPNWYFNLLAGSPDPELASQLPPQRIETILNAILLAYDYIFVDLGRSLSRISMPIVQRSNVLALIVSTDPATASLTQTVWEYLKSQGVDPRRLYVLQNRAVGPEGLTRAELEKIINLPVQITMPHMGGNFTAANYRHEPIITKFPGDSAALTIEEAISHIVDMGQKR